MSDGTEPFVDKALDYSINSPEFLPAFVDQAEFQKDWNNSSGLMALIRIMAQIQDTMSDTAMQSGSSAYVSALSYYNSVKQAAKVNAPEAKAIYEDMRKRFEKKPRASNGGSGV
nr:hypothetical protein [Aquiflexum gelatinilyticum]